MALGSTERGGGAPLPLVRPSTTSSSHNRNNRRALLSLAAGLALAACVCAVLVRSNNAVHDQDQLFLAKRMELAQRMAGTLPAELSFGDADFHASAFPSSVREGSVRDGVRPSKPAAPKSVAAVGLQSAAHEQALTLAKTAEQQLSFGDAGFHLPEHSPEAREGGVRMGKKPDFKPPLGSLGETGLKIPPLSSSSSSALAFGDSSSFMRELERPGDREGGVRDGKKPDFKSPLGDLGEVGLKDLLSPPVHAQTLATTRKARPDHSGHGTEGNVHGHEDSEEKEIDKKLAALAFGDADFHPSTQAPADREGSVRGAKTPDFAPPLGDLGSVGLTPKAGTKQPKLQPLPAKGGQTLVAKPHQPSSSSSSSSSSASSSSSSSPSSALAFGDAAFHPGEKQEKREGSVRGGKKPDFAPPLGDLGQTGLVAARKVQGGSKSAVDKRISAAAERQDVAKFFAKEESAAKGKAQPDLTSQAARSEVSGYFGKLAEAAAASNSKQEAARAKAAAAAASAEARYEQTLLAHDKTSQAQRDKTSQAESAHARHTQHALASAAAEKVKAEAEAKGGDAQVASAEEQTSEGDMDGMADNMVRATKAGEGEMWARNAGGGLKSRAAREEISRNKAKLEQLALKYDKDGGNKHGFHPGSMAKSVAVKKELEAARAIEKTDLDDCGFTLC